MAAIRTMYHTQERWERRLSGPILCKRDDAWLGEAYYFWYYISDAEYWGHSSKNGTGFYEIYKADICCDNVLDTVFNEDDYLFWLKQVEKVANQIRKETGMKATIKEINEYFKERGDWDDVDGILFQDIPVNNQNVLVWNFYYKKRIQLAVYTENIISNFTFEKSERCRNVRP